MGFKNMIGLIYDPDAVFIFTQFIKSLPKEQSRSGYAELLKHGLIADKETWQSLAKQEDITALDYSDLVYQSVLIKKNVTEQDPTEKGLRKILNFGHTIGHAIESYWLDSKTPLLHGDAIAIGMVSEAYLSYRVGKINESELYDIRENLIRLYGHHPKFLKPSNKIIEIMKHDKKNIKGLFHFSLLEDIGQACFDITVDQHMIEDSFLFYTQNV
jgi:3-dehydroquinate synthase